MHNGVMNRKTETWLEKSDVIPMFPTLVWKLQLEKTLHDAMDKRLLALVSDLRTGEPKQHRGEAWQSAQTLHQREELKALTACIDKSVESILRFLRIGYAKYELTGCWANILEPGASHQIHSHPNNYLSGVYYVQTPPGADTIYFHDPRVQTGIIRPPVVALTAENTDQVVVRVETGTLLLFPAYLQHSVGTNTSAEKRVSISFNVMFSGYTENLAKPLW